MFPSFGSSPQCPVEPAVQQWIESRMGWLIDQFGIDRLHDAEVILPTEDYFPDDFNSSKEYARVVLERVCNYVEIAPTSVELHFYEDRNPHLNRRTAGSYEAVEGKYRIWIEANNLDDPIALVATMAHELAHIHLLGHGRISAETQDHEPLTDLLTVFLGMGVITANSVIREKYWDAGTFSSWSIARQGYLTMPMYGYALALFARARGEHQPSWERHLRGDVLSAFRKARRFLAEPRCNTLPSVTPLPFPLPETAHDIDSSEQIDEDLEPACPAPEVADQKEPPCSPEELLTRYRQGERDFQDADLKETRLRRADLRGCDLNAADLYAADLTGAVLMKADLHDADLRFAVLCTANLRGANLCGADLSGADLSDANLKETNIRGADFSGASMRGTRLVGAMHNSDTHFTGVDFSHLECDDELRMELLRRTQRSEVFAGSYHGIWRLIILLAVSSVAAMFGALAGFLLGLLAGGLSGDERPEPALARVGLIVGALAIGFVTFWKLARKRQLDHGG
jgi:Pentapeptide repeats (8 copies)